MCGGLYEANLLSTIAFYGVVVATALSAWNLMLEIKYKFTKERSSKGLLRQLSGFFVAFLGLAIVLGIIFGVLAVVLSLFILNEQRIINIINAVSILVTTLTTPVIIWMYINSLASIDGAIKSIQNTIKTIKTVYIKLLLISALYMILGYILRLINQNLISFVVNTGLQIYIIQYVISLYSIKKGDNKPWLRN